MNCGQKTDNCITENLICAQRLCMLATNVKYSYHNRLLHCQKLKFRQFYQEELTFCCILHSREQEK